MAGMLSRLFGDTTDRGAAMIVDDEAAVRNLLALHLEKIGYNVTKASDASEAIAELEKGTPTSLFVLDIRMPGDDGVTLAKNLRKMPGMADVPILFVSGAFAISELEKLAGMVPKCAVVAKPFNRIKLEEALKELSASPEDKPRQLRK